MYDLRNALEEAVIETVVGRGYRFVANMDDVGDFGGGLGAAPSDGVVVRLPAARGASENRDMHRGVSVVHACLVKQLADTLAAWSTSATVVRVRANGRGDAHDPAATAPLGLRIAQ
jgi:hypothetical protein